MMEARTLEKYAVEIIFGVLCLFRPA